MGMQFTSETVKKHITGPFHVLEVQQLCGSQPLCMIESKAGINTHIHVVSQPLYNRV